MDLGPGTIEEVEVIEPNKEVLAIIREIQRQNVMILENLRAFAIIHRSGKLEDIKTKKTE